MTLVKLALCCYIAGSVLFVVGSAIMLAVEYRKAP